MAIFSASFPRTAARIEPLARPTSPAQSEHLAIDPSPHGNSVGRWEGDTLVIEVRNLSADTWLGDNGLFHTEDVRVIERLTRQGNTLTWQATVEDPAVLAEPWKMNPRTFTLRPPTTKSRKRRSARTATRHSSRISRTTAIFASAGSVEREIAP